MGISAFQASLRDEFTSYLKCNDKDDVSPIILWLAAVLRRKIIQLVSTFKKARTAKRIELENKVDDLEKQHQENTSAENLNKLKKAIKNLRNNKSPVQMDSPMNFIRTT